MKENQKLGGICLNKIGFGFLRLPQTGTETIDIDWTLLNKILEISRFLRDVSAKLSGMGKAGA